MPKRRHASLPNLRIVSTPILYLSSLIPTSSEKLYNVYIGQSHRLCLLHRNNATTQQHQYRNNIRVNLTAVELLG
jgi:hypothetical protein